MISLIATTLIVLSAGSPPKANPPVSGYAGRWITSWGRIKLVQEGTHLNGDYVRDNATGRIEGTVNGSVFTFDWKNLKNGGHGSGKVKLSETGNGFFGKWPVSNGQSMHLGGVRNPSFPGAGSGGPFAGLWKTIFGGHTTPTHSDLTLYQEGNQVMGTYKGGTGRGAVDGVVVGKSLRLTWVNYDELRAGSALFTLNSDGKKFKGTINNSGDPGAPGGYWNGFKS